MQSLVCDDNSSTIQTHTTSSRLVVEKVTTEMGGEYVVTLSNASGAARTKAYVVVNGNGA